MPLNKIWTLVLMGLGFAGLGAIAILIQPPMTPAQKQAVENDNKLKELAKEESYEYVEAIDKINLAEWHAAFDEDVAEQELVNKKLMTQEEADANSRRREAAGKSRRWKEFDALKNQPISPREVLRRWKKLHPEVEIPK